MAEDTVEQLPAGQPASPTAPEEAAGAERVEVHHKPRPVHDWREFAGEILVIVVGVLLALGAEQIVEAFHWRHEVQIEREALLREARDNVTAAAFRVAQKSCMDSRLAQLEVVFRRQARGEPLGLKARVGRPPVWISTTGSWDIAVSGQALGHMPQSEKLAFSDAFDSYRAWSQLREQEDAVWRRLDLLDEADVLGPADWPALHQAYGEAVAMNERIVPSAEYLLGPAALGQKPGKPDFSFLRQNRQADFCRPLF